MSTADKKPGATPEPNSFKPVTEASTTSPAARASTTATSPTGSQAGAETGAASMAKATSDDVTAPSEKSAADMAAETKDAAADRASELSEKAKDEAGKASERAKGLAADGAEQAKGYASDTIARQAESLREAGREYGEDSYQAHAADYLASNLAQAADVLRDKDLGALAQDVTVFARRNPALFLGGAALIGFAAARMMKATERAPERRYAAASHDDDRFNAPAPGVRNTPYGQPQRPAAYNGGYRQ